MKTSGGYFRKQRLMLVERASRGEQPYTFSITARIVRVAIRAYQHTLSPDHGPKKTRMTFSRCRFYPTCSQYALEAIRQYGLARGFMVSMKRIARCHPLSAGGYDPVIKK